MEIALALTNTFDHGFLGLRVEMMDSILEINGLTTAYCSDG